MNEIISNILAIKHKIWGADCATDGEELMDQVIAFMQLREYEIIISCNWMVDLGTGHEIVYSLL